jgi:hypothetical protein
MKKFLPYLKHLAFVIAIGILPFGYDVAHSVRYNNGRIVNIDWVEMGSAIAVSILIIFFLWKSNYFTRKK